MAAQNYRETHSKLCRFVEGNFRLSMAIRKHRSGPYPLHGGGGSIVFEVVMSMRRNGVLALTLCKGHGCVRLHYLDAILEPPSQDFLWLYIRNQEHKD